MSNQADLQELEALELEDDAASPQEGTERMMLM